MWPTRSPGCRRVCPKQPPRARERAEGLARSPSRGRCLPSPDGTVSGVRDRSDWAPLRASGAMHAVYSIVILTACYNTTAVFCIVSIASVEHFVFCHPDSSLRYLIDSRLHKCSRILYLTAVFCIASQQLVSAYVLSARGRTRGARGAPRPHTEILL
jgi:hypothetical protein